MLRRREISDLLRPERCSLRIWPAWSPAVKVRPNRLPFWVVVEVLPEPPLDLCHAHPLAFVIVGDLKAVDLAEG